MWLLWTIISYEIRNFAIFIVCLVRDDENWAVSWMATPDPIP
jgi:hypothetical protein